MHCFPSFSCITLILHPTKTTKIDTERAIQFRSPPIKAIAFESTAVSRLTDKRRGQENIQECACLVVEHQSVAVKRFLAGTEPMHMLIWPSVSSEERKFISLS